METRKLFYTDPFMKEFTATVVSCTAEKNAFTVVLDATAFYPEGGGQGADHGTLGGARVTDVHEKDGLILHTCDAALEVGERVTGVLDWQRRFDHMQQHSGEHILSGILCDTFHCDNVGFHLGADTVTIDYNAEFTWEQALSCERRANEVIWDNAAVDIRFPTPAELEALDYRSKKELTGQVRIVTFPEADCCACCGTHVTRAGQVGLIKILSLQKFRSGVRMEIVCGSRALSYLGRVYEQDRAVSQLLSVKPTDTAAAVERMNRELNEVKAQCAAMESAVYTAIADAHTGCGDVLLFTTERKSDSVRRLADAVAQRCGGLAAVFAGEDGRYTYALVRADGADIAPRVKEMNAALSGRGGGRGGFAQGSAACDAASVCAFFRLEGERV